jgi:S-adenosylmethionine synthetase
VRKVFRLTPSAIIETLELTRPIYRQTAAYGHFGRDDVEFSWECCNRGEELKSALV